MPATNTATTKIGEHNIKMILDSGHVTVVAENKYTISFGTVFLAQHPTKDPKKQERICKDLANGAQFTTPEISALLEWIMDQKGVAYPKASANVSATLSGTDK